MSNLKQEAIELIKSADEKRIIYVLNFLKSNNVEQNKNTKPGDIAGIFEGKLEYIADDFNETPEGFEEYI